MSENILINKESGILRIQINRPAKKNALTTEMYAAMADALAHADDEASIRVVYFTGAGDSFTAGNDLNDFLQNPASDESSPVSRFLLNVSPSHDADCNGRQWAGHRRWGDDAAS